MLPGASAPRCYVAPDKFNITPDCGQPDCSLGARQAQVDGGRGADCTARAGGVTCDSYMLGCPCCSVILLCFQSLYWQQVDSKHGLKMYRARIWSPMTKQIFGTFCVGCC
jgi:hypothetical protein